MVTSRFFFTLAATACVQAAAVPSRLLQRDDIEPPWTGPGGFAPEPPNASPRLVNLESDMKVPGAKRVKVRYGPYTVPNMNVAAISGEYGSLFNFPDTKAAKPCEECTIVKMQAGLEYPNGTDANIDSGMWLHHMVGINVGKDRWDATCADRAESLPHVGVGTDAKRSERFLSSGNERMQLFLYTDPSKPAGYHIAKTDHFRFIVDLMNMNMDDRVVYLTMTYDIVDGSLPQGWKDVKPVWLDVDQCGSSEVDPPQETGKFTIKSKPWTPNFEGEVLSLGGHLHDGGTNLESFAQDSSAVCNSQAKYAESAKYVFKDAQTAAKMGGDIVAKDHISSMTWCSKDAGVRKVSKDQSWVIHGNYDYDKFEGNKDKNGKQQHIMAISILYVGITPGSATRNA